ncbi:MAG: ParA family protein [Anaerolineae bacterium]|nr:ParA family protein [Anaerolineae bacterium]MCB0200085.1 ParA family protein [Anaerolineae bacterium]
MKGNGDANAAPPHTTIVTPLRRSAKHLFADVVTARAYRSSHSRPCVLRRKAVVYYPTNAKPKERPMRKIAVALTKGGVGKTTTAVNLAAGLALAGRKVLLIDVDTQGQAGQSLGVAAQAGLAELVAGDGAPDQLTAMARDNLYVLAGGKSLAGLKRVIARKDFGGERTLAEALAALDGRYDYVIVDTAPGWDVLTVNVLFYVDEVLAPVSLEVMTLQGLTEFSQSMASIQRYRDGLALRYVLPTFMDRRVRKSEEILGQLHTYFPGQTCQPIRYNVRLSEAPGYRQHIFEYSPRSAGAEDYRRLTERIMQDDAQGNA